MLSYRSCVVPGASTCDAAPATVAHIDQVRAASASMVDFYHNKDRLTPEEQPAAPQVRAESPHCVYVPPRPRCACICGQVLRACPPVLLPLKHLANRPSSYSKHCDEKTACGSQWTVFDDVVSRPPGRVTVRRWPTLPLSVSALRVAGSNYKSAARQCSPERAGGRAPLTLPKKAVRKGYRSRLG